MKIAVDAFGGDHAPLAVIQGAVDAVAELGVEIILTGNEAEIRKTAAEHYLSLNGIEISHTDDVIAVEDDPSEILKSHKDSSLGRALQLVASGEAEAMVSAGSSGALVYGSSLIVKRIKGVKRAAIATVIPCEGGKYLLIDSGANVECRPEMFNQFGVLGSAYMKAVLNVKDPKVGLLNIGAEETKGHDLEIEANRLMQKAPYHFIGNVEPRDVPLGACDVVVTDGFSGNIVLKLSEGLGKMFSNSLKAIFKKNFVSMFGALCVKKGISEFKRGFDYTEYGGAMLLGISKPVIKAHGSSDAKAIKNAIRQAKISVDSRVIDHISEMLNKMKAETQVSEDE